MALIQALRDRVHAEPGNLLFEISTRTDRPDGFFVYEQYRDAAAFDSHINADYGSRFNAELTALIEEDHSIISWLEPVS
ncbi:antibiotic biosynthesis monooxygenase [Lacisediminihabitans sp. G11-30]|uniref:Antibiotic biosynthesis monooxygenase n=2 Tax=Lacisediminihabitans changchengi TaxID=2787634 RepID=A0A934SU98_9MICO|nr:antibiotic biosynthesis monooxygenase [Lacisediminihabitans changchengi]